MHDKAVTRLRCSFQALLMLALACRGGEPGRFGLLLDLDSVFSVWVRSVSGRS